MNKLRSRRRRANKHKKIMMTIIIHVLLEGMGEFNH